jgi:hypothetical protein
MAPRRSPPALSNELLLSLKTFINTQGEEGPLLKESCKEFRSAFNAWRTGRPVSHGLTDAMRGLGFSIHKVKYGANDTPTEIYFGIHLKDVISEEPKGGPLVEAPDEVLSREELAPKDLAVVLSGSDYGEFDGFKVRRTDSSPPLVSILDLIQATTGVVDCSSTWGDIRARALEVAEFQLGSHQFPGERQKQTPITDAVGLVIILNLLPGLRAARFRVSCARIVVRYLGGDETLVGEIRDNRRAQEALPEEHPARSRPGDGERG